MNVLRDRKKYRDRMKPTVHASSRRTNTRTLGSDSGKRAVRAALTGSQLGRRLELPPTEVRTLMAESVAGGVVESVGSDSWAFSPWAERALAPAMRELHGYEDAHGGGAASTGDRRSPGASPRVPVTRAITSSAPRSRARTRSTVSPFGARRITGTLRSQLRPGSPRLSRKHRSSSARRTRSGRSRSARSSASLRLAAPSTSKPSSRSWRPRYSRVSGSGSATSTALCMPATLVAARRVRQMSFAAERFEA